MEVHFTFSLQNKGLLENNANNSFCSTENCIALGQSLLALPQASIRICSITFPRTKVRLNDLEFPSSFLKMGTRFAFPQLSWTSSSCNDLSKMLELHKDKTQVHPDASYPVHSTYACLKCSLTVFPNGGYYFIPRDSASSWAVLSKGFVRDFDTCLTTWLGYDHTSWPSLKCHKLFLTIRKPCPWITFQSQLKHDHFFPEATKCH